MFSILKRHRQMKSKRARLQQILVFTILSLGLIASLLLASKNQDIRKEAAAQSSFTFAVISDTHAGIDPNQFSNFHKWANYNHTQAVKKIKEINPAFYLHLGDMVESPTSFAWGEFFKIESSLINSKPIYPAIGNHERYHTDKSYYTRFRQFIQPKNLLSETNKPWKIVFFHVSIYSSLNSPKTREMRNYLHPLFKKYGVKLVLSGHNHFYERVVADGITYITAGGGKKRRGNPAPIFPNKKLLQKKTIFKKKIIGENP